MRTLIMAILFVGAFFAVSAMPASAAEFEGAKRGLPSLVMLATPT